jgi:hypothetical protein
MTRLRDVLVMVVALFVLGASSQAAVCELVCGPQVAAMQCSTSAMDHSDAMVMSDGHCTHGMASMQMADSVNAAPAESCGHAVVPVFAKGGSSFVVFSAVHWVLVGVVPVDRVLTGSGVGVSGRPPILSVGVDPLVVSLRV